MARFTIYSKEGAVRSSGTPQYNGSYMGVDYLEFRSISSPTPIDWERGDFVDYYRTGLRYKLYTAPLPKKVARGGEYGGSFEYSNVQFHAATKELEIAPFRDIAPADNRIHFSTRADVSTFEDVYGIARRIQACMDDLFPNRWRVEVVKTEDESLLSLMREVKEYTVSSGSCLDALSQIYELWKNIGWVHSYDSTTNTDVITIGRANVRDEENTSDVFAYGKGNGLTSIKKAAANDGEFATRLYVYGSERNIPPRYYNSKDIVDKDSVDIRNLMIPLERWGKTDGLPDARKAYLQADAAIVAKYGLIPRTVYFDGNERDEIYPSIEGLTKKEVRQAMIEEGKGSDLYLPSDEDTRIDEVFHSSTPGDYGNIANADGTVRTDTLDTTFTLEINNIGFDISKQAALANESKATISMKSGKCAGREFAVKGVKWDGGTWVLTMERQLDDSLNMLFPNQDYMISEGDRFVLLNIAMPQYYISINARKLFSEAERLLADYTRVSAYYEPGINPIRMKENGKPLHAGMYMQVYDEDIIETDNNTDYVLIDTLSIDEAAELPQYKVTLREEKRAARTFTALEGMIEDAKVVTKEDIRQVRQYTDRRFRSAQESLSMLQDAFREYAGGINPVTVQTMALLVGDESLQFIFTDSKESLDPVPCPFTWHNETRQLKVSASVLKHMTLGIDDITVNRRAEDYRTWVLHTESLPALDDVDARYVYINASESDESVEYVLSKDPIEMRAVDGRLHLLVGILNSEYNASRDFITLYGFTEVLPGQITTDVIRSADGSCYFDLANNEIGGVINFKPGSKGLENLDINVGSYNLLRNSGFTGDYLSETLADEQVVEASQQMYSDPLDHWEGSNNVVVVEESASASGYAASMQPYAVLVQSLYYNNIMGEKYVFSFRAKGQAKLDVLIGGTRSHIEIDSEEDYIRYNIGFVASESNTQFVLQSDAELFVCELNLERGTIASAWGNSWLDNTSDRAYYQSMRYLQDAMQEGSTTIGGGLVLTNHIKVGNYADGEMIKETGGISGTWTGDENPAFWAGGSFEKAAETVKKYKEDPTYQPTDAEISEMANFVVTHGGRAVLNDMILRGYVYALGGKIGDIEIADGGLRVNVDNGLNAGTIEFLPNGFMAQTSAGTASVGASASGVLQAFSKSAMVSSPNNVSSAIISEGTDDEYAFYSRSGMFGGLRPNIRKMTASGALTSVDHTLVIENTGRIEVELPYSTEKGQTYRLIHTTGNNVVFVHHNSQVVKKVSGETIIGFNDQATVTLTFLDNVWYAEFNS